MRHKQMTEPEKTKIEKEILIDAPLWKVWISLTDREHFGAWFRVKLDKPFRPGEKTTGTLEYPGYEHLTWECDVKEMIKEKYFSFTWHPYAIDESIDYSKEESTLVEFHLEKVEGGVLLKVTESGFEKNSKTPIQ